MSERTYPYDDERREWQQRSAAEVPAFDVRTTIDDAIGKLFALRSRIRVPVPAGLGALVDDVDALIERAVELGFDPDADDVGESWPTPNPPWYGPLGVSASCCLSHCSCGSPTVSPIEPTVSAQGGDDGK